MPKKADARLYFMGNQDNHDHGKVKPLEREPETGVVVFLEKNEKPTNWLFRIGARRAGSKRVARGLVRVMFDYDDHQLVCCNHFSDYRGTFVIRHLDLDDARAAARHCDWRNKWRPDHRQRIRQRHKTKKRRAS